MEADLFAQMEERLQLQGHSTVFEALAAHARERLEPDLMFQTLAMQARRSLGLPLIESLRSRRGLLADKTA